MNKKTLTALRGSIRKWEKIIDGSGVDKGSDNCPLCKMFLSEYEEYEKCNGCPIKHKTGLDGCGGTPFVDFREWAFIDEKTGDYYAGCREAKAAAKAELRFLKSLLPKRA